MNQKLSLTLHVEAQLMAGAPWGLRESQQPSQITTEEE